MAMILVGLDGSVRAPGVLARAIDMAQRLGGRMFVVRAVPPLVEYPPEAPSVSPDPTPEQRLEQARAELATALASVPAGLLERTDARLGKPSEVLCEAARECGAELLIVGTHGYNLIDRLLGTTAASVVNRAPCSVLVVRNK